MIQYPRYKRHRFSSFQVIIAGFAVVDLVGALLLNVKRVLTQTSSHV